MAAINYIVVTENCPSCNISSSFRFQTHIASDYYDCDHNGPFMNRSYCLGEKMAWLPPDDVDFDCWATWGELKANNVVSEECLGVCSKCKSRVQAEIKFKSLTPVSCKNLKVCVL